MLLVSVYIENTQKLRKIKLIRNKLTERPWIKVFCMFFIAKHYINVLNNSGACTLFILKGLKLIIINHKHLRNAYSRTTYDYVLICLDKYTMSYD